MEDALVVKKLVPVLLVLALIGGCAVKARHIATVSVVSAHSVLSVIQDSEILLVCGRSGAPAAPLCVPIDKHRQISILLEKAFSLEKDIAGLTRAVQPDQPLPPQIPGLLSQLSTLIGDVLALIPESSGKAALSARITVRK
jgi:hypothetical protein